QAEQGQDFRIVVGDQDASLGLGLPSHGSRYARAEARSRRARTRWMPRFWARLVLVTVLGVAVFAAFSIYADVAKLGDRLRACSGVAVALALALAAMNYVVRFARWQLYLGVVGVAAPLKASLLVFVGGFAMSVTPGKLGELVKALLLREAAGADPARVAPVVVAERATDLVALVILGIIGVAAYGVALPMVAAAGGGTGRGRL